MMEQAVSRDKHCVLSGALNVTAHKQMVLRRLGLVGGTLSDESPPFYACMMRDMLGSELYFHPSNLT